ncbi:MAG: hypothetical protein ACK559_01190, partial [bacterium]
MGAPVRGRQAGSEREVAGEHQGVVVVGLAFQLVVVVVDELDAEVVDGGEPGGAEVVADAAAGDAGALGRVRRAGERDIGAHRVEAIHLLD